MLGSNMLNSFTSLSVCQFSVHISYKSDTLGNNNLKISLGKYLVHDEKRSSPKLFSA